MSDDIPLFEIPWDGAVVTNVVDSITRGSFWANGPYVEEFERRLETYFDVEHAVVFNSGTTALVAALESCGIGPGDEVIVPSFTFISTANAVKIAGGTPVFADIERECYGLDPDAVREAITDDTVAILPVHYAGKPCRIEELQEIASEHDLSLIEDAAEAHGAERAGEKVGTFGDVGMLSFCQNKVVPTGEGGAILTDEDSIARESELLRSHGRSSGDYFESAEGGEYTTLGNNFRMPDVVASIGVAQMARLEEMIDRRRWYAGQLHAAIDDVRGVTPLGDAADGRHVYQLYTVRVDADVDRDAVVEGLADRGVASKVYFDPVHRSTFYRREYESGSWSLPVTEDVSSRVLSLPVSLEFDTRTVARIGAALEAAVEGAR